MDQPLETHWDVRSAIYLMHRSIAGSDATVLIGDSITEGFYWNKIGDCAVVNAGFGGITTTAMTRYIESILRDGAPKYAVIMLGSNPDFDSNINPDFRLFQQSYTQIVDRLMQAGTTVIVVSIPPVEPEKLRVKRSMEAISTMNRVIRDEIAAPRGLEYIDLYSKLTINGKAVPGATTDGIHFAPDSYRIDYKMIDDALKSAVEKTGKSC